MKHKTKKEEVEKYVDNIILIQDVLVRQTNETRGIRDKGGTTFSANKIIELKKQKTNPFEIAAVIYEEFTRKHFFHEGNKRIAHTLANAELLEVGFTLSYKSKTDGEFVRDISKYKSVVIRENVIKWLKKRSRKIPEKYRKKYKQAYIITHRENGK